MPGPRVAVTAIFFLNGLAFSSWYARLEAIQDDLAIGTGLVGLALLGAPLGLVVAQPLVGALVARRGSPAVLAFAPVALAAVLLPALAVDVLTLLAAAFVVGALNGALDIAMNAQGIAVERRLGRRLFTSLHAGFSFGALAGAGLAALAVHAGLAPATHLLAVAIVAAAVAAALRPAFMDDALSAGAATPSFARPTRALAIAGTVAFCALLAEGAIFDWSGIFLADEAGASDAVAPLGLAVFSLTMAVGRLGGDSAAERFGLPVTAGGGLILAALGLTLAAAAAAPVPSLAGFAVMGIGLASVFPLALRAAESGVGPAGPALAAVSTVGYTGLFLGPPSIGLLAELVSLRGAFFLVVALCAGAAVLVGGSGRRSVSGAVRRHRAR